ncbi:MAG: hypothetical protein R3B40_23655 [Polyangiales bacterium]|nr:hypothetical protein [Myxococcales bacterium]MCB9661017.1 hypothetical protein [Sandaracinaceae bacterium]
MRFMGVIVIAAAAVLATGCATRRLRSASAGSVGCAPRDIEIGNTSRRLTGRTWTAECHGAVYQCSGLGTDVTCSPLRESVASSERPSSMGVPSSAGAAADARRREELLERQGPAFEFARDGERLRGVRATFSPRGAQLVLTYAPESDPLVALSVRGPDGGSLDRCESFTLERGGSMVLVVRLTEGAGRVALEPLLAEAARERGTTATFCGLRWPLRTADVVGFQRFGEHAHEALLNAPEASRDLAADAEPEVPSVDAVSAVRAALTERSTSLRACAGARPGQPVSVEATWGVEGVVHVAIRGSDDAEEHACATAALSEWRAPSGAAGRIVHAVEDPPR